MDWGWIQEVRWLDGVMHKGNDHFAPLAPRFPFILTVSFFVILWVAGGASRADALGQTVTRAGVWLIAISLILFAPHPRLRPVKWVALILAGSIVLVAAQLIPLPPSLWTALPGRDLLQEAAGVSGQKQPWRPLSISPGGTWNALSSLVVPTVALFLLVALAKVDHWRLAMVLLSLVFLSSLIALVQYSGGVFDNPFVNDIGDVSGLFANRNHFALFMAIGCLLTCVLGFRHEVTWSWRPLLAIGFLGFFVLIILATGSRMGMAVGVVSIGLGVWIMRYSIAAGFSRVPRKISIPAMALLGILLLALVALSVLLGRAESIDRALGMQVQGDLRNLARPTVVAMVIEYFPFGTGFGTFDPAFRISEPDELLGPAYFNQAHNDFLQVGLDGGFLGFFLLGLAVLWWAVRSFIVWHNADKRSALLQKTGSSVLLLVMIASLVDYPARTPMIMAIVIVAAVWLSLPLESREPVHS